MAGTHFPNNDYIINGWHAFNNFVYFINRNIVVLSGRLISLEGVSKTFIIWVELLSVMLRDHFVSVCKGSYSI